VSYAMLCSSRTRSRRCIHLVGLAASGQHYLRTWIEGTLSLVIWSQVIPAIVPPTELIGRRMEVNT